MKKTHKLSYILLFAVVLCGCKGERIHRMLAEADTLAEHHSDMVYKELFVLDTTAITSEADRALYGLLLSQTAYMCEKKADTAMLSRSIRYFSEQNNARLLQRSYYYRGVIKEELKSPATSFVLDYKKAERLIPVTCDSILRFRIYEALYLSNFNISDAGATQRYARKELEEAYRINESDFVSDALNNRALSFLMTEQPDSALVYMRKLLPVIPSLPASGQAIAYGNVAALSFELHPENTESIEKFLKLSLMHGFTVNVSVTLTWLYLDEGKIQQALSLLKKVKQICQPDVLDALYDEWSKYYAGHNDYEQAYAFRQKSDSIAGIIQTKFENEKLTELQMKYDNEVTKSRSKEEKSRLLIIIPVVILLSLLSTILLYEKLRRKNRQIKFVEKRLRHITADIEELRKRGDLELKEKTAKLERFISADRRLIESLKGKVKEISAEMSASMQNYESVKHGLQLLYYIMNGEEYRFDDNNDRIDFIACFRVLDNTFVDRIENLETGKLTLQEEMFCILCRLGKSSEQILAILCPSKDALRKTRGRALSKLCKNSSLAMIADNIARV